jgi:hypothetical protein
MFLWGNWGPSSVYIPLVGIASLRLAWRIRSYLAGLSTGADLGGGGQKDISGPGIRLIPF